MKRDCIDHQQRIATLTTRAEHAEARAAVLTAALGEAVSWMEATNDYESLSPVGHALYPRCNPEGAGCYGGDTMSDRLPVTICPRCERRSMHYPNQCSAPCNWGDHDIKATYQNYGYWRGQCSKCMKVWEVDSSG